MGRCNPQVARFRVNRLPAWIPHVVCYAPDSECFYPQTNQGGTSCEHKWRPTTWPIPGCLYIHIGSTPTKN